MLVKTVVYHLFHNNWQVALRHSTFKTLPRFSAFNMTINSGTTSFILQFRSWIIVWPMIDVAGLSETLGKPVICPIGIWHPFLSWSYWILLNFKEDQTRHRVDLRCPSKSCLGSCFACGLFPFSSQALVATGVLQLEWWASNNHVRTTVNGETLLDPLTVVRRTKERATQTMGEVAVLRTHLRVPSRASQGEEFARIPCDLWC